jgi:hypothetical protein
MSCKISFAADEVTSYFFAEDSHPQICDLVENQGCIFKTSTDIYEK